MTLAEKKLKEQMDKLNAKIKHSNSLLNKLKNKKQTSKVKNSIKIQQKNIQNYKKQIATLKVNMQKAKIDELRSNTLENMRKNPMFSNDKATLVPQNPNTNQSYVILFMKTANADTSPQVNTKAVEKGMNLSTTTQQGANTISFEAIIGGGDVDQMSEVKREIGKLRYWSNNGVPLIFHSNNYNSESVQISAFTNSYEFTDAGTGINSANVSITLTEAQFFETNIKTKKGTTKYVGHKGNKKGTKNSNASNKHRYVIAKSGVTYLSVARSKHVSLAHVRKLNKYADRSIPIGAKIYY